MSSDLKIIEPRYRKDSRSSDVSVGVMMLLMGSSSTRACLLRRIEIMALQQAAGQVSSSSSYVDLPRGTNVGVKEW